MSNPFQATLDRVMSGPWYKCPRCAGEYSRLMGNGFCVTCNSDMGKGKDVDKRLAEVMGERAFKHYRLENFLHLVPSDKIVKQVAEAFDPHRQSLYFLGDTGTGKTHLAMALIPKWFQSLEGSVEWIQLGRYYNEHGDTRKGLVPQAKVDALVRRKLLIIDEVGLEGPTDQIIQLLYDILDGRIRRGMHGLVVTSNLSFDQLGQRFGSDRLPSRLAALCGEGLVMFEGPDKRLMNAVGASQDAYNSRKDLF